MGVQPVSKSAGSVGHSLRPYVDELPILPVIDSATWGKKPIEIDMREIHQTVHRDLPPTAIWGYNGNWPGPTILARTGRPLRIEWSNRLPKRHLLPIDTSIHGAEISLPAVRTVTHIHGASVAPEHDGFPDAWFTASGETGPAFQSRVTEIPNDQSAATLWYHDHCMGITRLNVYAGLSGFYLISDEDEDNLRLPSGQYDIPLMLQDRQLGPDGRLLYPKAVNGTHPVWIQEFFGDVNCVNGKAMPYLPVEARRYRFRILNASNARFYHIRLQAADKDGKPLPAGEDAPPFQQIGSDGGLLPRPVVLGLLLIGPGERFDVVIDFGKFGGKHFALVNDAPAPYTMGGEVIPAEVMLFHVGSAPHEDASAVPETLVSIEHLQPQNAARERVLSIGEVERPSDGYVVIGLLDNKRWHEPITEDPKVGTTEIWTFANTTSDVHPMHLHLVKFEILNRQAFDVAAYLQTGKLVLLGRPIAPERNERPALKDTIKTYPGYVTRIIARFDLPKNVQALPGRDYRYVWHCHILEHEDNEMMRPYKVVG